MCPASYLAIGCGHQCGQRHAVHSAVKWSDKCGKCEQQPDCTRRYHVLGLGRAIWRHKSSSLTGSQYLTDKQSPGIFRLSKYEEACAYVSPILSSRHASSISMWQKKGPPGTSLLQHASMTGDTARPSSWRVSGAQSAEPSYAASTHLCMEAID